MPGATAAEGTIVVGAARVRVVTDHDGDEGGVVAAETRVVRALVERELWPHETVTLFLLDDLAPLVGQLRATGRLEDAALLRLPLRPMVNLYDPRHAMECFVFVNRRILRAEGFWGDPLATEGLLAHEHAHPLSEAPATAAARGFTVTADGPAALAPLAADLGHTLTVGAIAELLANGFCLANGFADALGHLDRLTLRRAIDTLPQRSELTRRAARAVAEGGLPAAEAETLARLADARLGLPFALEVVPFIAAGHHTDADALEGMLTGALLPAMAPAVADAYVALRAAYRTLDPEWGAAAVGRWCAGLLDRLSNLLSRGGARLTLRLVPAGSAP